MINEFLKKFSKNILLKKKDIFIFYRIIIL
jgi:hypothetical protein